MLQKKWVAWICPLLFVALSIIAFITLNYSRSQSLFMGILLAVPLVFFVLAVADIVLAFVRKKKVGGIVRIVLYLVLEGIFLFCLWYALMALLLLSMP